MAADILKSFWSSHYFLLNCSIDAEMLKPPAKCRCIEITLQDQIYLIYTLKECKETYINIVITASLTFTRSISYTSGISIWKGNIYFRNLPKPKPLKTGRFLWSQPWMVVRGSTVVLIWHLSNYCNPPPKMVATAKHRFT